MQTLWKDGVFAQKVLWLAEALTPINLPSIDDATLAAALSYCTIAYGGLLRGQLQPSQTVVVNGATGGLGAAAILVALAMGASKVAAVGRNQEALAAVTQLDPQRVISVNHTGNPIEDAAMIIQAVGKSDLMIDFLGAVRSPEPVVAGIDSLRPRGTAVFMGGVKADIPLPYAKIMLEELNICGAFMYPRHAPGDLLRLIAAGLLNVNAIQVWKYTLEQINEAIASAANLKGLEHCVLVLD